MPKGVFDRSLAKKRPESWRMNQSKAHMGKKLSEETKKKMSASHMGLKPSEETLEKLRRPKKSTENYHKPKSEVHRLAISMALKGRKMSPEWKEKNSMNRKGKCIGNINRLGKPQSDEAKIKIGLSKKGEKNHNWKGGITPLQNAVRRLPEFYVWWTNVVTRDGFKDVITGQTGEIEVHHKVPFSQMVLDYNIKTKEDAINCKAFWDVDNGITLLKTHHRFLHDKYGDIVFTDKMYKDPEWKKITKRYEFPDCF